MISAILFDLDETLVAQERAFRSAYCEAGEMAAACAVVDAGEFARDLPEVAQSVMERSSALAAVRQCCFGGRDVLWGDPSGGSASLRRIEDAAPEYRADVWRRAFARQGIADEQAVQRIGYHFPQMMLSHMAVFAEVKEALESLAGRLRMGIVTNGMPGAQNAKLRRLGLDGYFDSVVASAAVERGKPAAEIFEHALGRLRVSPEEAVMVGDSLDGDVLGAARVGIRGVWINRDRAPGGERLPGGAVELRDLSVLPSLLFDGSASRGGIEE